MVTRREFLKTTVYAVPLVAVSGNLLNSFSSSLPNVLIIGDSISIGYTPFVQEFLKGRANVYRPLKKDGSPENCSGTTNGVKNIDRWISTAGVEDGSKGLKWDIIHFNFGLHDLKHVDPKTGGATNDPNDPQQADVKQYAKNLKVIVKKLKATGAKVMFATTTPFPDSVSNPLRQPVMAGIYNKAASKIMKRNGVYIDDLYSFVLPQMSQLQRPSNVHFTDDGSRALGEYVAQKILELI